MKVELVDFMGSDTSVVNAARVSFSKEASNFTTEQNHKLIIYLAKHNHFSPFCHAFASLRIKAPIFVARQLVKHQVGLAWNEVSRRYVDDEPEFWFPDDWRGRPVNAKQGSTGILNPTETGLHLGVYVNNASSDALNCYQQLIARGVAPEQARMVLPQNTMTEWIWSGSLMAFARVVKQRTDEHAQQETQEIAKQIKLIVESVFPESFKALMENSHV